MYLTRSKLSKRIPVQRKGTKYIARALRYSRQGVPVVVAVRDMLGLAKTSKEVKLMVKERKLKLNGKEVGNHKDGICLFNVLDVGKKYKLIVLKTGRFDFVEVKEDTRTVKVIGKVSIKAGKVQVNLHDGTNILTKEKVKVGDSIVLQGNKIKKILPLEKGKDVFVMSGRSIGEKGKIKEINGKNIDVQLEDREVVLDNSHVIVI